MIVLLIDMTIRLIVWLIQQSFYPYIHHVIKWDWTNG